MHSLSKKNYCILCRTFVGQHSQALLLLPPAYTPCAPSMTSDTSAHEIQFGCDTKFFVVKGPIERAKSAPPPVRCLHRRSCKFSRNETAFGPRSTNVRISQERGVWATLRSSQVALASISCLRTCISRVVDCSTSSRRHSSRRQMYIYFSAPWGKGTSMDMRGCARCLIDR